MQRSRLSVAVTLWLVLAACGKSPSAPSSPGQGGTTFGRRDHHRGAGHWSGASGARRNGHIRRHRDLLRPVDPRRFCHRELERDLDPGVGAARQRLRRRRRPRAPARRRCSPTVPATKASMPVLVLERGTFKLSGRIVETGDRPLEGVSIDVVSGTGAGLRATANSLGEYALYGVAGPTQLRVSGNGFTPQVRDLVVTADTIAENFVLAPKRTARSRHRRRLDDDADAVTHVPGRPSRHCEGPKLPGADQTAGNRPHLLHQRTDGHRLQPAATRPACCSVLR